MKKDNRWIICPLCGWNRKLIPSGRPRVSFVKINPHYDPCIDLRDTENCTRGSGFPRIGTLNIDEMKQNMAEYGDILVELREQAQSIIDAIGDIDDTGHEVKGVVD